MLKKICFLVALLVIFFSWVAMVWADEMPPLATETPTTPTWADIKLYPGIRDSECCLWAARGCTVIVLLNNSVPVSAIEIAINFQNPEPEDSSLFQEVCYDSFNEIVPCPPLLLWINLRGYPEKVRCVNAQWLQEAAEIKENENEWSILQIDSVHQNILAILSLSTPLRLEFGPILRLEFNTLAIIEPVEWVSSNGVYQGITIVKADTLPQSEDVKLLSTPETPATTVKKDEAQIPKFSLNPAYPNPFNPYTNLNFTLPNAVNYSMKIYNVAGQLVKSYESIGNVGMNVITWDGKDNASNDVSSGIYFYKLIAGNYTATNKMILLK